MMDGGFLGFGPGHWGLGILLWVGFIAGAIVLIRGLSSVSSGKSTTAKSSALEILKERYARGEIDDDEFASRKRELER